MTNSQNRRPDRPTAQTARVLSRRGLLQGAAGAAVAAAGLARALPAAAADKPAALKGRIRQSICLWCFESIGLEKLAVEAVRMGVKSIELVEPKDWPILKKHNLICALSGSHGFLKGLNRKENHAECLAKLRESIDLTAAAGFPSVITFSGLREGMPDDVGLENTVLGLKQIIGHAEKKKVNLCFEMLNSRVDRPMMGHPDYMCDRIEWAVEACKRVASERMKILFDIYHVQIMQGDLITRIKQYASHIGHYHTAGVPGRNEIDAKQEINYPAVMEAIAATGYQGYVGQEFVPTRDPLTSLREAVKICDV